MGNSTKAITLLSALPRTVEEIPIMAIIASYHFSLQKLRISRHSLLNPIIRRMNWQPVSRPENATQNVVTAQDPPPAPQSLSVAPHIPHACAAKRLGLVLFLDSALKALKYKHKPVCSARS